MKRRRVQKQGTEKKQKKSKDTKDTFFEDEDDHLVLSSDDDNERKAAEQEQEEENPETAHEKKVRLAKEYLSKLKGQVDAQDERGNEEDEVARAGRRDTIVADLLRQEKLEEDGRIQRKLASRLIEPAEEGKYAVRKHKFSVTALALSEDDKWGFSGSKDGLVLQWDVETGKAYKYESPVARKGVLALAVDSSGRYLATGGWDRTVHLWDVRTQQHIQNFPGHKGTISALGFRQGTTQLFSGSFDRSIKLWSADDRSYMDTLFGHQSEILTLDCLRQERVLSAARDRTLRLFKVPEETQLVFRGYSASLESACFLTNSEFLSGADDGSVALWSALKKKPLFVAKNAHGHQAISDGSSNGKTTLASNCGAAESWVGAVAVCRSSDLAASGAGDGKVQLWAVGDGNRSLSPLHTLPVNGFVNALTFARSGQFLLAGVGQEPRFGRWAKNSEAKNGVLLHKLEYSE